MSEKRFLFRREYLDIVESLPSETQQLALIEAVVKYGLYQQEMESEDKLLLSIFELIKLMISKDLEDDEIYG